MVTAKYYFKFFKNFFKENYGIIITLIVIGVVLYFSTLSLVFSKLPQSEYKIYFFSFFISIIIFSTLFKTNPLIKSDSQFLKNFFPNRKLYLFKTICLVCVGLSLSLMSSSFILYKSGIYASLTFFSLLVFISIISTLIINNLPTRNLNNKNKKRISFFNQKNIKKVDIRSTLSLLRTYQVRNISWPQLIFNILFLLASSWYIVTFTKNKNISPDIFLLIPLSLLFLSFLESNIEPLSQVFRYQKRYHRVSFISDYLYSLTILITLYAFYILFLKFILKVPVLYVICSFPFAALLVAYFILIKITKIEQKMLRVFTFMLSIVLPIMIPIIIYRSLKEFSND